MNRKQFVRTLIAAAAVITTASAMAQAWPARPVRMVIPFPPGGTLDMVGRNLAQKLTEQTGQTFFVENKAGGQGMIGADVVAKATADGYTLLFNASTFTTTPMVVKSAPYDVVRDFTPIALTAKAPLSIAINKDLPVQDLKGLISYAKTQNGKLNFAIGSNGSAGHLATELLKRATGMDLEIVPYKGTGPAMQDLVGGQIQGFIDPVLGSFQFHKTGKLKVVGVTSSQRVAMLSEVEAVAETVPGFEFYSWYGVWAPAKLPADIAQKLNAEINKALQGEMKDKLTQQGLLVGGGSSEDFVRFQREDMARSQKIITDGNIRAE
jgi:tripartite-type tricarboxylate transporter receptor subunit TctC